jgi:hypothetical protein
MNKALYNKFIVLLTSKLLQTNIDLVRIFNRLGLSPSRKM